MEQVFVRLMVAALLAFKALDDVFATALTIAYRRGALGVAEHLGRATPGDDYRRLVPLMDAVPVRHHGLWVLAGLLYLAAVAYVLLRKGGAHLLILAAVGFELVAMLAGRPIAAATGVVVNSNPGPIAAVRFVLPLLLAAVLWQTGPRGTASKSATN